MINKEERMHGIGLDNDVSVRISTGTTERYYLLKVFI